MMLEVRVKPSAQKERVRKLADNIYSAWVNEPAKDNRANFAVIKLISEHFGKPVTSVRIVRGQKSTVKTIVLR